MKEKKTRAVGDLYLIFAVCRNFSWCQRLIGGLNWMGSSYTSSGRFFLAHHKAHNDQLYQYQLDDCEMLLKKMEIHSDNLKHALYFNSLFSRVYKADMSFRGV